ncbi:MAG: hypothetical protein J7J33_03580, partial [Caldisericia bacterium]|nr:hypothetical protein [Caldisericia bacterium]
MKKFLTLIILMFLLLGLVKSAFSYESLIIEREYSTPQISFKYVNGKIREMVSEEKTEPPFSLPFVNIRIPI